MTVSASRFTLFPSIRVGSRERLTVPVVAVGVWPPDSALRSPDSKSTRPARKPGVCRFAMLSAVTRCRWASPFRAECRADEVTSPITGRFLGQGSGTRSASGYAGDTRERGGGGWGGGGGRGWGGGRRPRGRAPAAGGGGGGAAAGPAPGGGGRVRRRD